MMATSQLNFPAAGPIVAIERQILGLTLQVHTSASAIAELERRITCRIPTRVAFANANLVNCAHRDPELMRALQGFFILNDGSGINIASRVLHGRSFPGNLNGTDFTPSFLSNVGRPLRIFLLGARQEVVTQAQETLSKRWPMHQWVGCRDGYFTESEWPEVAEQIRECRPDLVLVGLGNGLQEKLMERIVPSLSVQAWGVGALFDFLAGRVRRAPGWMRELGIEWVFRLLLEPRRLWHRYLIGNFVFLNATFKARRSRT